MRWDFGLMLAGLIIIALWAVMRVQRERYEEAEQRRKQFLSERGPSAGLRRPRRRRWGDSDRPGA